MAARRIKKKMKGELWIRFMDKMSHEPKERDRAIAIRIITSPIRLERIVKRPAFRERGF